MPPSHAKPYKTGPVSSLPSLNPTGHMEKRKKYSLLALDEGTPNLLRLLLIPSLLTAHAFQFPSLLIKSQK